MNTCFFIGIRRVLNLKVRMVSILAPSQSAVDEKIHILVEKLNPNQNVSIVAQTTRNEVTFSSFANFCANADGKVDFAKHEALEGGSYQGLDPMGLFWSMELTSKLKIPFKMLNGNDLDKWQYKLTVIDGHCSSLEEAIDSNNVLTESSIDRLFLPSGVKRVNVFYGQLRGVLFLPEGKGPFPAVIDIFGGANGLVAYRGGLLARHGFACLCIAYAAYADLPKDMTDVDMDYFNLSYEFLAKHPQVYKDGIGIMGSCLGGTIGLTLAACQPGIKAVATVSPESFAGTFRYHLRDYSKGKKSEKRYVMGAQWVKDPKYVEEIDGAIKIQGVCKPTLERHGDWNTLKLDYSKINIPVLAFFGTNDIFFDLPITLPKFKEQFEGKNNLQVKMYKDAGHIIQPPYLPVFSKYYSPYFQMQIWFGGVKVPHAAAQEDMWLRTIDFFKVHLSPPNSVSKL